MVPPIYVKPYVKRQKNDAADAAAICEAASRPTMRFVAVKTQEQQARMMLFRTRDLLVRQRTQTINALRGHLAEFGVVAPKGRVHVGRLALAIGDASTDLPAAVRELGGLLLGQIDILNERIAGLEKAVHAEAKQDEDAVRLMSVPGIGPVIALAIQAFAPPMEGFERGRDFSAWLGLVPRQHTTGGKPRLGRISKMGQRDLRRLLVVGAMSVIRNAVRSGRFHDPMARPDAGAQAEKAGCGRPGQPDGAHRLGLDDETGELPGACAGRRLERLRYADAVGDAGIRPARCKEMSGSVGIGAVRCAVRRVCPATGASAAGCKEMSGSVMAGASGGEASPACTPPGGRLPAGSRRSSTVACRRCAPSPASRPRRSPCAFSRAFRLSPVQRPAPARSGAGPGAQPRPRGLPAPSFRRAGAGLCFPAPHRTPLPTSPPALSRPFSGQGPQAGAAVGAAPVEAGQFGLQLHDPDHERGRALLHRGVPGLLEPAEQDLRLVALDRPPRRPDVPHPSGDIGPVQKIVPRSGAPSLRHSRRPAPPRRRCRWRHSGGRTPPAAG